MAIIRVTPEELKQSAQQFKEQQGKAEEMVNQLNTQVQGLAETWEGAASARFKDEWPQYQKSMQDMGVMLEQISQQLIQTADKMQAADEEAASGIGQK